MLVGLTLSIQMHIRFLEVLEKEIIQKQVCGPLKHREVYNILYISYTLGN